MTTILPFAVPMLSMTFVPLASLKLQRWITEAESEAVPTRRIAKMKPISGRGLFALESSTLRRRHETVLDGLFMWEVQRVRFLKVLYLLMCLSSSQTPPGRFDDYS